MDQGGFLTAQTNAIKSSKITIASPGLKSVSVLAAIGELAPRASYLGDEEVNSFDPKSKILVLAKPKSLAVGDVFIASFGVIRIVKAKRGRASFSDSLSWVVEMISIADGFLKLDTGYQQTDDVTLSLPNDEETSSRAASIKKKPGSKKPGPACESKNMIGPNVEANLVSSVKFDLAYHVEYRIEIRPLRSLCPICGGAVTHFEIHPFVGNVNYEAEIGKITLKVAGDLGFECEWKIGTKRGKKFIPLTTAIPVAPSVLPGISAILTYSWGVGAKISVTEPIGELTLATIGQEKEFDFGFKYEKPNLVDFPDFSLIHKFNDVPPNKFELFNWNTSEIQNPGLSTEAKLFFKITVGFGFPAWNFGVFDTSVYGKAEAKLSVHANPYVSSYIGPTYSAGPGIELSFKPLLDESERVKEFLEAKEDFLNFNAQPFPPLDIPLWTSPELLAKAGSAAGTSVPLELTANKPFSGDIEFIAFKDGAADGTIVGKASIVDKATAQIMWNGIEKGTYSIVAISRQDILSTLLPYASKRFNFSLSGKPLGLLWLFCALILVFSSCFLQVLVQELP